jgi:hypothetical protein
LKEKGKGMRNIAKLLNITLQYNVWGFGLKKNEALAVLHEIFDSCLESIIIDCVSLDPEESPVAQAEDFRIKVKCNLDRESKNLINPILTKHKLELKQEKGFVILYSNCDNLG